MRHMRAWLLLLLMAFECQKLSAFACEKKALEDKMSEINPREQKDPKFQLIN